LCAEFFLGASEALSFGGTESPDGGVTSELELVVVERMAAVALAYMDECKPVRRAGVEGQDGAAAHASALFFETWRMLTSGGRSVCALVLRTVSAQNSSARHILKLNRLQRAARAGAGHGGRDVVIAEG
jgi:hypothetical protein